MLSRSLIILDQSHVFVLGGGLRLFCGSYCIRATVVLSTLLQPHPTRQSETTLASRDRNER